MQGGRRWLHALVWMLASVRTAAAGPCSNGSDVLRRGCFPGDFIFGSSTSAYQVEGAAREGGRGPSIWDTFTHRHPEKIVDGSNGDVADDFYHRHKEDLKVVKEMGFDAFRFSISWSRILPNGKGETNKEGIQYYNNLIDEILSHGLLPFATIFHWDTPQSLEDEYGGFLSPSIVSVCLPLPSLAFQGRFPGLCGGVFQGIRRPGEALGHLQRARRILQERLRDRRACAGPVLAMGDGQVQLRRLRHGALHRRPPHTARARRHGQAGSQRGAVGVALSTKWVIPLTDSESDVEARSRAVDFAFGWFLDPLVHGEYPLSMRTLVEDRLPAFTEEQSEELQGTFDFVGINYYTTSYVHEAPPSERPSYTTDARVAFAGERNGVPIGPLAPLERFHIYPEGLRDLLLYMKNKYNDPAIFVTENGVCEINNSTLTLEESLADDLRVHYHHRHLLKLLEAIREGVNVKGYFAWSLLDNFEWNFGYTQRYGLVYVDFRRSLERHRKKSASWFQKLLTGGENLDMMAATTKNSDGDIRPKFRGSFESVAY